MGSLAEPLGKLQDYATELTAKFAQSTAESLEAGSPPTPTETERWVPILQASFPKQLQRAEQEARIMVNLTVAKSGEPTYCEVVDVVGITAFIDTASLLLLRHARFNAATNGDGEPVPAFYSTRNTYRINK